MRKLAIAAAVFLLWALPSGAARAGLYCTSEPSEWPSPYPFVMIYTELRAMPTPAKTNAPTPASETALKVPGPPLPSEWKPRYLRNMALLEEEAKRGALSDQDRINLSFYYIRFQKYAQALEILKPIAGKKNFYALANLATAEFLSGELDRAAAYQEEAIQAIPPVVAGWGREELYALRRLETLFLTLLNHRKSRSLPGRPAAAFELDPLFPGVRYEKRSGDYEAGAIPPGDWAALPPDALSMVMQLAMWLPFDNELYWQFGELLNASGNYLQAYAVLDELVAVRNMDSPSLRRHRVVLGNARSAWSDVSKVWRANDPTVPIDLFAVTFGRGLTGVPVAGDVCREMGWAAALSLVKPNNMLTLLQLFTAALDRGGPGVPVGGDVCREIAWAAALTLPLNPEQPQVMPDEQPRNPTPPARFGIDWKQVIVAFLAGAVVSWLLSHQFRQARPGRG